MRRLAGDARARATADAFYDGWLRLEVTFQDLWHAEWALWQLGTNAEALAPPELRTSLHARAQTVADRYREPA